MPIKSSPLLGYNDNVRYKGKVFHIQTEDSGARYGHVISHIFVDGGRILKSLKASYAEHADSEQRPEIVRELMKRLHKAMFAALREGRLDAIVDGLQEPRPPVIRAPVPTAAPSTGKFRVASPIKLPQEPARSPSARTNNPETRHAMARLSPASTRAQPQQGAASIFGESTRSNDTLSGAILTYLAAEADRKARR